MTSEAADDASVKASDIRAGKYRGDRVLGIGGRGVGQAAHYITLDESGT
jgi:hypothetical protein